MDPVNKDPRPAHDEDWQSIAANVSNYLADRWPSLDREDVDSAVDLATATAYGMMQGGFTEVKNVKGWVTITAHHILQNEHRRFTKREVQTDRIADCNNGCSVQEYLEKKELIEALTAAILALPLRLRKPLIAHIFDGATCDEISSRTGRAKGTVRNQISEAKKMIRRVMDTRGS